MFYNIWTIWCNISSILVHVPFFAPEMPNHFLELCRYVTHTIENPCLTFTYLFTLLQFTLSVPVYVQWILIFVSEHIWITNEAFVNELAERMQDYRWQPDSIIILSHASTTAKKAANWSNLFYIHESVHYSCIVDKVDEITEVLTRYIILPEGTWCWNYMYLFLF